MKILFIILAIASIFMIGAHFHQSYKRMHVSWLNIFGVITALCALVLSLFMLIFNL